MTRKEVKKVIGKGNWRKFAMWMYGQTCGMTEDGQMDYYECDVEAFKRKLDTGVDRQKNPLTWD